MATALRAARRPCLILIRKTITQPCPTRSFFGLGQIAGVIANPAETLRQLNESREMLEKTKDQMQLRSEAKKIPKKHTFAKLPGFHGRKTEQTLLRKILANDPRMTVLFGATSVGKTALLREVLAGDDYYIVAFDLRISGFADLRTLYFALCEQFQQFFENMNDNEMSKQALVFKHLSLELSEKESQEGGYQVTVADLASLMESLQSCLLKYWEYDPQAAAEEKQKKEENSDSNRQRAERKVETQDSQGDPTKQVFKKRPIVFLMDEAHKLPALMNDQLSLKVFLDTLLVLTKQDRLCHVIFSTSDSFFQHFLRSMNVGHHSQVITIGDCPPEDTLQYFHEKILPSVPKRLASSLSIHYDEIYDAFSGKLSHINDYISSWVNADGDLKPYQSAIFIQAYTLLEFHLTRTKFETYSPLSTAVAGTSTEADDAKFSPDELIYVMRKLVKSPFSMPYFELCREIGTNQVDSMIKTRILELRWTRSATAEDEWVERVWSQDGIERPIVLPMTRIIRRAMEVVLKEEDERMSKSQGGKTVPEKPEQQTHEAQKTEDAKEQNDPAAERLADEEAAQQKTTEVAGY